MSYYRRICSGLHSDRTVTGQPISSPIGCFACHSPHSRADFSLRTTEPVTMLAGVVGEADPVFDYGKGNLCANCHKPRSINPKPDPTKTADTDTITITSSRWYQHYGVQGPMLAGTNGFEFQDILILTHSIQLVLLLGMKVVQYVTWLWKKEIQLGGHTMKIEDEEAVN